MRKTLLVLSMMALTSGVFAQNGAQEKIVTFRFVPGEDMFYIPWQENDVQLNALYALVDLYRAEITSGAVPVYVDSYSSSMRSGQRNAELASVRANRVKSELITHKGLVEDNFITNKHRSSYESPEGVTYRDLVVVTLRIPAQEKPAPEPKSEPVPEPRPEQKPGPVPEPQPVPEPKPAPVVANTAPVKPYCLAVRTNVLYDAFLLPTLGIEWRISPDVGVKIDGSRSWWGNGHGKVQKIWLVSPEVRWYLLDKKRFYVGASANFGEYNIYKYMVGGLFSSDTGYQGKLWNVGATVGYQLYLSRSFSLDLNLGLGYTRFKYDSFTISEQVRVFKDKDKSKNFWGPTQIGINLIWTICGSK